MTIEVVELHEKGLEPKPFHPGIVNLSSNFPKMAAFNGPYRNSIYLIEKTRKALW